MEKWSLETEKILFSTSHSHKKRAKCASSSVSCSKKSLFAKLRAFVLFFSLSQLHRFGRGRSVGREVRKESLGKGRRTKPNMVNMLYIIICISTSQQWGLFVCIVTRRNANKQFSIVTRQISSISTYRNSAKLTCKQNKKSYNKIFKFFKAKIGIVNLSTML